MRHDPVVLRALAQTQQAGWARQAGVPKSRLNLRVLRLAAAFAAGWLLSALL